MIPVITKPLVVIGAGWHGREVMKLCGDMKTWGGERAFIDDIFDPENKKLVDGVRVHGKFDLLEDPDFLKDHSFALGIGDNERRAQIGEHLKRSRCELVNVRHPSALVWSDDKDIGAGTVIMPNAIVSAGVKIGRFCIIGKGAHISHGAQLGEAANVCDHAVVGGDMGDHAFMGFHAASLPGVKIGAKVKVGAGAIVTEDLQNGVTATGIPAKAS